MPVGIPVQLSPVAVAPSLLTLSTAAAPVGVTGHDGQPAAGRRVVVVGEDQWGAMVVVAETWTDATGDFSLSINAGPNDRFAVLVLGDPFYSEYSRVIGNVQAVS